MRIIEDDLPSAEVADLLGEHLSGMAEHSPPESFHALDLTALRAPGITFWTAWEGPVLLGCGAFGDYEATLVLWWVPEGHVPTVAEAQARLEALRKNGASAHAFGFSEAFPTPGS